jgi:predicted MPP superfamily phosphohydrolase
MTKFKKVIFYSIAIVFITFVSFTIWDNHRIKVVREDIILNQLPKELEGFQIVQITDLHEREFGKNQSRLLEIINSLTYDVIVFTGDMLENDESTNYQPFYTILEGINHPENVFVVPGNDDPFSYQYEPSFDKSEYMKGIEERGATPLESIVTIKRNGKNIHFVNLELAIIKNPDYIGRVPGTFQAPQPFNEQYMAYQKKLWGEMVKGKAFNASDVIIALNHYPIPDVRMDYIDETDPNTEWRDFDLIIAGHYHGGQIRLPLFGALFIPEPWYEPNSFFPPRDRVKGLWEYKGTKQYVSTGLGASAPFPLLKFRVFNPPEINVLTLRSN